MGALGWPGQDQCTSLLGSRRRMYDFMLEVVEEEEEDEVEEGLEADGEGEIEMGIEMAMEMDPPAVGQARAPHPLPAVGGFTSCWAGSGEGWPRCRDPAPHPLILVAQLPALRCPEYPCGVGEGAILWGRATTA